ncbi:RPM1-interacting protein 4-like [Silene latifolia]|uniref:RPM1-interacting protein 4-like n=1 Tax=Silene latifolia TaxID=37657 RepID=UPI003D77E230
MASKVPKFGAWEGGNENFTVYFDTARKTKHNGMKINPNDPEENPDLFGGSAQAQAQAQAQDGPSQTRADEQRKTKHAGSSVAENIPAQAQNGPSQTRADGQRRTNQGGPSVAENKPQAQARPGPKPQVGRAKVPQFGAWNGGEGAQYTAYFDTARKTKNDGGVEPVINRDVSDKGRERDPPATKTRVEPKEDVSRNSGRGSTSSESLGKQNSGPKTPVHPKVTPQTRTSGGRGSQGASIPQYGAWNTDPSQAEGYTVAFARAKEERKTPLHQNVPPSYQQQPQYNNPKQASCCSIL